MQLNTMGLTLEVSAPFAEGQTIDAAAARTLNQTRLENISNNVRQKLKDLLAKDVPEGVEPSWTEEKRAEAEKIVREIDANYTFGMGRSGSPAAPRDPVSAEARRIASEALDAKLKEKGTTLTKARKENKEGIEAKIAEWAQNPKVVALAQKRVKEREKQTKDLFGDLGEPAAAE